MKLRTNKASQQSLDARGSLEILASADTAAVRTEIYDGQEYLVVPVVALVEGVLHPCNSEFPELALAETFGKHAAGWNGRPVTMGHPSRGGTNVSANSPEVLSTEAIGKLFNTHMDGKKLKTEAWINLERVKEVNGEATLAVQRIRSGDTIEVSTGLFATVSAQEGEYDGKEYAGIWQDTVPDHLALLPAGTTGACSVGDGCGAPRLNQNTPLTPNTKTSPNEPQTELGPFQKLMGKLKGLLNFHSGANISDSDIRSALEAALAIEDPVCFSWIVAVFDKTFVYESGRILLLRGYSITAGGAIKLAKDSTEVRPVTEFVPINLKTEARMNTQSEKVDALIANEGTAFTKDDHEWLSSMSEEQLDKIIPNEQAKESSSDSANTSVSEDSTTQSAKTDSNQSENVESKALEASQGKDALVVSMATPDEFIKGAPAEIQEVLTDSLRLHRDQKDTLVKGLLANARCEYSEDELKDMQIANLRKLSKLGDLPDYTGCGSPKALESDSSQIPPTPEVFPIKQVG